jgi:hypothetical protein
LQAPASQVCPAGQQVLPHTVSRAAQAQSLLTQLWAAPQATPQPPQFCLSELVSTHRPLQVVWVAGHAHSVGHVHSLEQVRDPPLLHVSGVPGSQSFWFMHVPGSHCPLVGSHVRVSVPHFAHMMVASPLQVFAQSGKAQALEHVTGVPSEQALLSPGVQPGCLHMPSSFQSPVDALHVRVRVPPHSQGTSALPVHVFEQAGKVQLVVHVTVVPSMQALVSPGVQPACLHTPSLFQSPVIILHVRVRVPLHSQLTSGLPEHASGHGGMVQSRLQVTIVPPGHITG